MHGGDKSMAQKMFSLQEVLNQNDALDEVAADQDSAVDFGGEWCYVGGDLDLHSGDGSVCQCGRCVLS